MYTKFRKMMLYAPISQHNTRHCEVLACFHVLNSDIIIPDMAFVWGALVFLFIPELLNQGIMLF